MASQGIFSRLFNNAHQHQTNSEEYNGRSSSPAPNVQQSVDKKLFEKAWKRMDEVVRSCQNPQMKLKNSPPYLLEILPECYRHLYNVLDNSTAVSLENEYIRIFLFNMIAKCKRVKRLFSDAKEKMYDEKSQARRDLTKFALVFSHMFFELKSLYPADRNYTFIAGDGHQSFHVTKVDAAEWWKSNFGSSVIVPWDRFLKRFCSLYRIDTRSEVLALKTTLDLTCDDCISIFEFDVFTRLFQPWANLVSCWKLLAVVHPAFMAFMTYDDVKEKLSKFSSKPGSYIFRLSCTRLGQWAIGYVTSTGDILQTIPQNKSLAQALADGQSEGFYKYPDGQEVEGPDISVLLTNDVQEDQVVVSQELYDVYVEMGTTFQACKICTDRDKDTRIEPCGHLICSVCVNKWMNHDRDHSCPFCRREIKGTGPIRVELSATSKSNVDTVSSFNSSPSLSRSIHSNMQHESSSTVSEMDPYSNYSESENVTSAQIITNATPSATSSHPGAAGTTAFSSQRNRPKGTSDISPNSEAHNVSESDQQPQSPARTGHLSAASRGLVKLSSTTVPVMAPPLPRARSNANEDAFIAEMASAGYDIREIRKALEIAEGSEVIARRILVTYVLPPSSSGVDSSNDNRNNSNDSSTSSGN